MDITHAYIEKGSGEPLILLHGNGQNYTYFSNQFDVFAERFHVYALDTRGHGQTPRGVMPFTMRGFAEDLLNFMDEHSIAKAHILGFSDGGNIALLFAIRHPERVDRLIVDGADINTAGVKPSFQLPIELGYRMAKLFGGKSPEAAAHIEMLNLMVNEPNIPLGELRRIKAKTLVLAGTNDIIKDRHTRLIAANIPGAELTIIEGDHFIAKKNPAVFNKRVLDFLSE